MSEVFLSQMFADILNEHLRDVLEAIAETVREVVCGIDSPLVVRTMMWCGEYTICDKVPHHRVPRFEILLHPQNRLTRLVSAVLHLLKFSK